jgi:hypothetical protein
MTIDLAAIKARAAAATSGPWTKDPKPINEGWFVDGPVGIVAESCTEADAELISAARQDIDDLVAECERLRRLFEVRMTAGEARAEAAEAEVKRLRDVLEWSQAQCPGKCRGVIDAALATPGERG